MPLLQSVVQFGRRFVLRGWAPALRMAARINPRLRAYRAALTNGDTLVVDLSQPMCLGYFFDGCVPHNSGLDRLMRHVLYPGATFVDVGANIGYYTRLARNIVGAQGHVHAFEPLPAALPLLIKNAGCEHKTMEIGHHAELIHNSDGTVFVHPVAVGAMKGEVNFYEQAAGDTSSLAADPHAKCVRVSVVTLDTELANLPALDLLKIDVEGYELEVLQGALETIRKLQPVIEFELLDGYSRARGISLNDYEVILKPLGYALYWSNHASEGPMVVSHPKSSDVVAVPSRWMSQLRL